MLQLVHLIHAAPAAVVGFFHDGSNRFRTEVVGAECNLAWQVALRPPTVHSQLYLVVETGGVNC